MELALVLSPLGSGLVHPTLANWPVISLPLFDLAQSKNTLKICERIYLDISRKLPSFFV